MLWQVYLDNLDILEVANEHELREWVKTTASVISDAKRMYSDAGVALSEAKSLSRVLGGKLLGSQLFAGIRVRGPPDSLRSLVQFTVTSFSRPKLTKKWLQILSGRWVRHQQIETSTSCCFSEVWSSMARWPASQALTPAMLDELLCCIGLMPKMSIDLRLPISGTVTVSDASLAGGAVCHSVGVTPAGQAAVARWLQGSLQAADEEIALLAVFDGIGGARRAVELCNVNVAVYMSVEIHEPAKRVVRYAWPTRVELGSVRDVTVERIAAILLEFPRVRVLLVVGGFPCKGLSSANIGGAGITNEHSVLIFELLRLIRELREGLTCTVEFVAECVASMSPDQRVECTRLFGVSPILVHAHDISHARRSRLYWCSFAANVEWGCPTSDWHGCLQLHIPGGPGPTSRWKGGKVSWPRRSSVDRFNTFLRARPQKKEPILKFANGRDRTSPAGLKLWAAERWKYSPYHYMSPNIVRDDKGWRTLNSEEREVLLDFRKRHTITCMATRARKVEPQQLEDERCGLLGDSFSCGSVAYLLQHLFVLHGYMPRLLSMAEMRSPSTEEAVRELEAEELAVRLAQSHIVQADPRGSDVRLDSGEISDMRSWPRRPIDVSRWKWRTVWKTRWKQEDHITLLETVAAHLALVWRTSSRQELKSRFLHLVDNQASLSALAKSRSSSRALHRVLRRGGALLLAASLRRALGYTETDVNPADAGSRE